MKFQTPYNRELFPREYEVFKKPSLTVPDMSLSIKMILDRYTRGVPLGGRNDAQYYGENDDLVPADWERLDFADRQEVLERNREVIKEMEARQAIEDNKRKKEEDDKKFKARFAQYNQQLKDKQLKDVKAQNFGPNAEEGEKDYE